MVSVILAMLVAAQAAQPSAPPMQSSSAPQASGAPCPRVAAKLLGTIDTKIVTPGVLFRFATTSDVTVDGATIPAGTQGVGVVDTLDHSKSHGESGYLVLEARYLELAGGSHVPVFFAPGGDGRSDSYVRAGSSNAPSLLGYVPYVGIGAAIYDYFHHGKDAAVVAGATFELVAGDGFFRGTCAVTPR